jgi:galactokinase
MRAAFGARFGTPAPTLLVRAPGRVNLIGEHIDYNGLSVLPMAIQRHVMLIVRPRTDRVVRVASTAPGHEPRDFEVAETIPPFPTGDWGNYVKAAIQALEREHGSLAGFDALIHSTVPVAAGLSSSSALVIGVALALLTANRRSWDPLPLAEAMAQAERYTGTQGGGMDQAISLGAVEGTASRVDFAPLRITPVPVPPAWRFIVAHSLSRAEKSGGAQVTYNRRTVECREALQRIEQAAGSAGAAGGRGGKGYPGLLSRLDARTLVEMAESALDGDLLRRFRHVVTEADRVRRAEAALRAADLPALGDLLSASHASLRDDYEVSSPALDVLVALAEEAGAVGARLTGAGMGGCIVAVAPADAADTVLDRLRADFYAPRSPSGPLDDYLFVAEPSAGATVTGLG